MILIAGLVLCSALFGFGGGIIAALIMLGYTLFFFSTDHSFTQFTEQNLQKVVVSLIGITADMVLVCSLKSAEVQAFSEVANLTEQLKKENKHLQSISLFDPLTGIRNRLALRQDFDSYNGREVTAMMLDIDNFKQIKNGILQASSGCNLSELIKYTQQYNLGGFEFATGVPAQLGGATVNNLGAYNQEISTYTQATPPTNGE